LLRFSTRPATSSRGGKPRSAKITGKVAAVPIEEGQRVEAGEVIARLDDANARAHVAHALAQLEQARASFSRRAP
jgi:multidrug resistance efflux pump